MNCECRHLPPLSVKAQKVQHDPVLLPHPLRGLWLPHTLPAGIEQMFSRPRSFIPPPVAVLRKYYKLPLAQGKSDMKGIHREVGAGRATSIELLTPQDRKHMNIRETEVECNNPLSKCQRSKWDSDDFLSVYVGTLVT